MKPKPVKQTNIVWNHITYECGFKGLPADYRTVLFKHGVMCYLGYFTSDPDCYGFYVYTPEGDEPFIPAIEVTVWSYLYWYITPPGDE